MTRTSLILFGALVLSGCKPAVVFVDADGGAGSCASPTATEVTCAGGVDDDCDGLVDCADPDCEAMVCGGAGFACASGGCVHGGDFPELPRLENVRASIRVDTAVVEFSAFEGARDYRIYPYPENPADIVAMSDGTLTVKNAIYRCAGDYPRPELDTTMSLGWEAAPGNVIGDLGGYTRKESDSLLGYVFTTPGPGRTAVYKVADPGRSGNYLNAEWSNAPGIDFSASDYVLGEAARDAAVAAGKRDDGARFYVTSDATRAVYSYDFSNFAGPVSQFLIDGPERQAHNGAGTERFKILPTQVAGSVPLHRVWYSGFDVLVAGEERFQQVLHQGNRPITSLTWADLKGATTLVVEALDQGCPFPQGYIGFNHAAADQGAGEYPSLTVNEARLSDTSEVFVNGQHPPTNRPKPIARSFVDVTPKPPPQMDFFESFSSATAWAAPPLVATDTSAGLLNIYRNDKWSLEISGTENQSFGPALGAMHTGCSDWGSACGFSMLPRVASHLEANKFLHVRMSVDLPSTLRRYPGIFITTTPMVEVSDVGHLPNVGTNYLIPVSSRWGPLAPEGSGTESTVLVHPLGGTLNLQFCDRRGWGVGAQCKSANIYGRNVHWNNNAQPWLPVPVIGELAGFDRQVQFDVYASTSRVYLFIDDKPAGCGVLTGNGMPAGAVTVGFHGVGYHLGIDDPADPGTPNKYLRTWAFNRTDRNYDDVGISNAVDAPMWDEQRYPCGSDWQ